MQLSEGKISRGKLPVGSIFLGDNCPDAALKGLYLISKDFFFLFLIIYFHVPEKTPVPEFLSSKTVLSVSTRSFQTCFVGKQSTDLRQNKQASNKTKTKIYNKNHSILFQMNGFINL